MDKNRPFRYTRGRLGFETTLLVIFGGWIWLLIRWGFRRMKPIAYHPVAILGIAVFVVTYAISPWITTVLFWALLVWQRVWPYSYLRHVHPRVSSFLAGFRYRHRPRAKLGALGLLSDKDPITTVSHVSKTGCTTKVRWKMSYGDDIEYWRERSTKIAQTYNALDCKINPYRRNSFTTIRFNSFTRKPPFISYRFEERAIQPRWLELEFLTRDPFTKTIGPEYIDFWRSGTSFAAQGNPVGPYRSGQPHRLQGGTHKLVVAPSRRGKSSAERAMVYADHWDVQAGLIENWGLDLKRGVEIKFMEGQFTRTEYGLDGPLAVAQFWSDVKAVMNRRLDQMRERGDVLHIATPADPSLKIYVDEFLAHEDEEFSEVRPGIYRDIAAIQRRGAAADVEIRAFAQDPKKDKFPLRGGFLQVEVGGGLTRTQVEMVMPHGWDAGVRAEDIDLPGIFYVRSEALFVPEQFRYALIPGDVIKGLPRRPDSALWPFPIEIQKDISGVLIA